LNDESRPARTASANTDQLAADLNKAAGVAGDRQPPLLLVRLELEELPVVVIVATTAGDEARLRHWLTSSSTRRRLFECLADALDELAFREAA
jgi:hypothetical protein